MSHALNKSWFFAPCLAKKINTSIRFPQSMLHTNLPVNKMLNIWN
jgi:hypothetical protein